MVKLTRITTKTGDGGETGLVGGVRVAKCCPRVEAIGMVDEVNAAIGLLRAIDGGNSFDIGLFRIQHDLFDIGADLATPENGGSVLRVQPSQTKRIEAEMEHWAEELTHLHSFVLPGGSPFAAQCHWVRVVVRKAERAVCALAEAESINAEVLKYLNRLSDYFFQLARVANDYGRKDVLWEPGKNR